MKKLILIFAVLGSVGLTSCHKEEVAPNQSTQTSSGGTTTPPVITPDDSIATVIAQSFSIEIDGGFRVGDMFEINGYTFRVTSSDNINSQGFADNAIILERLHNLELQGFDRVMITNEGVHFRGDVFILTKNTSSFKTSLN